MINSKITLKAKRICGIAVCLSLWTLSASSHALDAEESQAKSLQQELSALRLQVSELQQIVNLLQHHMKVGSDKAVLDSDPGLEVSANETVCTKLVERLRAKLHAMKAYGYTERHPDVRQLTKHLEGMSSDCAKETN